MWSSTIYCHMAMKPTANKHSTGPADQATHIHIYYICTIIIIIIVVGAAFLLTVYREVPEIVLTRRDLQHKNRLLAPYIVYTNIY